MSDVKAGKHTPKWHNEKTIQDGWKRRAKWKAIFMKEKGAGVYDTQQNAGTNFLQPLPHS